MVKESNNFKKYQKNIFFSTNQKCHHLSFPILGAGDSTRAPVQLQSSPFQISGGDSLSVTNERQTKDGNPCI